MLTLAQLHAATIQADVAKEAYAQVEKRLADLLETKKSFESRAASLMSVFITLTLALTGAGASFYTSTPLVAAAPKSLPWAFFVAAIPLFLAAWSMLEALNPAEYGTLGTSPKIWLESGVIDGAANVVPAMQAYMVHYMNERIPLTDEANNRKAGLIVQGGRLATSSPFVLALAFGAGWYFNL